MVTEQVNFPSLRSGKCGGGGATPQVDLEPTGCSAWIPAVVVSHRYTSSSLQHAIHAGYFHSPYAIRSEPGVTALVSGPRRRTNAFTTPLRGLHDHGGSFSCTAMATSRQSHGQSLAVVMLDNTCVGLVVRSPPTTPVCSDRRAGGRQPVRDPQVISTLTSPVGSSSRPLRPNHRCRPCERTGFSALHRVVCRPARSAGTWNNHTKKLTQTLPCTTV